MWSWHISHIIWHLCNDMSYDIYAMTCYMTYMQWHVIWHLFNEMLYDIYAMTCHMTYICNDMSYVIYAMTCHMTYMQWHVIWPSFTKCVTILTVTVWWWRHLEKYQPDTAFPQSMVHSLTISQSTQTYNCSWMGLI